MILDFGGSIEILEFNRANRDAPLRELAPRKAEAVSLITDSSTRSGPLSIVRSENPSSIHPHPLLAPCAPLYRLLPPAQDVFGVDASFPLGQHGTELTAISAN